MLQEARTLKGAILPDDTPLPKGDNWLVAFEAWCETVETERGFIVPASLDDGK